MLFFTALLREDSVLKGRIEKQLRFVVSFDFRINKSTQKNGDELENLDGATVS